MESTFYDWSSLATVTGATAATLLIVQYTKVPMDKVWRIPTRAFVWIVAFVLLLCAQVFSVGFQIDLIPLTVLNAFVVALAAMGAYEATFAQGDQEMLAE